MKRALISLLALSALLVSTHAFAGDTTELLDQGAIEVDPAFTIDNIHDGKPAVASEIGIVYGVLDGFNIGAGVSFASEEGMNFGSAALNLNALATPLDTDHVDVDVAVDFDFDFSSGYSLTPSFELNYDLEPDLALWGLYLKFGLPIYGSLVGIDEDTAAAMGADTKELKGADVGISLSLGTYYTINEIHQIVVEGGFEVNNLAENMGETVVEAGYLSLGYNVVVNDSFELTTELAFNIPSQDKNVDEEFNCALSIGGIFTIGGGASSAEVE